MTLVYGIIWGSWVIFGIVVVWAFAWALRSGQFEKTSSSARMLFDEEEPIGQMTDTFPGMSEKEVSESDGIKSESNKDGESRV